MVSAHQWLKDAEAHVASVLEQHHFDTCTEPMVVNDLYKPLVGEKVRGGRIVALVKALGKLWVKNRDFGILCKRDLMLFEFVAWSLRRHMRCFQAVIGFKQAAKLRAWVEFRNDLNSSRGTTLFERDAEHSERAVRIEGDEQALDADNSEDDIHGGNGGTLSSADIIIPLDEPDDELRDDEESESNAYCAKWFDDVGRVRPEKPPGMPSMMPRPHSTRLVPTQPADPPQHYGPMKKRPPTTIARKLSSTVPSEAPPALAVTPKWGQIAPSSAIIDPLQHSVPMMPFPMGSLPAVPFPPPMPSNSLTLGGLSESEVALREQNAYLRGLLATGYRSNPYATW
jgi:hypothetical protein